jgi:PncC family amidohydrolase
MTARRAAPSRTTADPPASIETAGASAAESPESSLQALDALARQIGEALRAAGKSLALAESCTGGLVGHVVTEVAGASAYLRGGVIAYGDDAKADLLDVPRAALRDHGAVSAQVAVAMAGGARVRFGADLGAAVTGISGPSGGTAQKPVGLTYVAVADGAGTEVRRFTWSGGRSANKRDSARATLELILERLTAPS